MRYHVLACDCVGTLATDGRVDEETIAGLEQLRDSGRTARHFGFVPSLPARSIAASTPGPIWDRYTART